MAPFKFARRGPGAQAPALWAARCACGVHSLLSASPGGRGGAPTFAPPTPGAANRRRLPAPREGSPAGQQAKCE